MRFVIVTGLSGAGKTEATRTLEDMDYFCVDNLHFRKASYYTDTLFHQLCESYSDYILSIH